MKNLITGQGTRRRKRGPRSILACTRRNCRRVGDAPADATPGQSGVDASVDDGVVSPQSLIFYSINIKCLLVNLAELCHQVKVLAPHVLMLQETWLNKSIEEIQIPYYKLISRRDRSEGDNKGGIATYARLDVINFVEVRISSDVERVWQYLHY